MDPGLVRLAVIGCCVLLVVLELVGLALFVLIGMRNGFVRKSYVNEITGERVESTLPWLGYVQVIPGLPLVVLGFAALFKLLDAVHQAIGTGGVILVLVVAGVAGVGVLAYRRLNRPSVITEDVVPASPATPVRPLGAVQPAVGWSLQDLPPHIAEQHWSASGSTRPGE